jgi:hypothetical protein
MGIYKQPGKWECGPFALKHALLMRGILASEWEISRLAGSSPEGTDEAQLARAASNFGCAFPTVRRTDGEAAREELIGYLHGGAPCLLCVNQWDHWVTAVHEEDGQFIILDSEKSEVIVILDWPRLRKSWVYYDEDRETLYDLHPVIPRNGGQARARFTLEWAHHLRDPENRGLAQLWDSYVEDLITLCGPPAAGADGAVPLGQLLARNSPLFLDQLQTWHRGVERQAAEDVINRMRFVADTYGLTVPLDDERRVIAAVSTMLAIWCAGEFGIEPLYRRVPVRRLR